MQAGKASLPKLGDEFLTDDDESLAEYEKEFGIAPWSEHGSSLGSEKGSEKGGSPVAEKWQTKSRTGESDESKRRGVGARPVRVFQSFHAVFLLFMLFSIVYAGILCSK